jgi:hypothetical protein
MKASVLLPLLLTGCTMVTGQTATTHSAQEPDLGLQLAENPPMRTIHRTPPPAPPPAKEFEVRDGFTLVDTLDGFRDAIREDGQKIRMKPGIYRATTCDPSIGEDQQIFAVTGSNNHFDLRGVVFETPVSVQSTLSMKAHVSDVWRVYGNGNTFEGGYFRNVTDMPYPTYRVAENEFEIRGDGTTFLDCVFVIRGSVPYGYSDFYGKGGPNFGRLNKHSFMAISAKDTKLVGCQVYMQSFGHAIHFHGADGVLIKDCLISGTLRPTNDIFRETAGRAKEYDFQIMYRGTRPIPRDQMIPLTEDAIRTYGGDRNIRIVNTTVERQRGCLQLHAEGDVTLDNVTVREPGDFGFDISAGDKGKVTVTNCRGDVAYNPLLFLWRGPLPQNATYDFTILSPAEGVQPTERSMLGYICGKACTFVIRDGTTRPLPETANRLECGIVRTKRPLVDSEVTNYTTATIVLNQNVSNCTIRSVGSVEDHGTGNMVLRIKPLTR